MSVSTFDYYFLENIPCQYISKIAVILHAIPFAAEVLGITGQLTLAFFVGVSIAVLIATTTGTVLAAIGGLISQAKKK